MLQSKCLAHPESYTINDLLLTALVHNLHHLLLPKSQERKNLVWVYNLHQLLTCPCGGQMCEYKSLKFGKKNVQCNEKRVQLSVNISVLCGQHLEKNPFKGYFSWLIQGFLL